ncbi:MAG: glyoxalase [Candidatus Eisenbacteria bacterium]|uniref:Glyoxalase n=1 Tax=Eiseniibacteriota bacterium TaxID=2212470 RepID=A0A849SI40_UNCEI|nr:glyoxalase [Candidatus Eisenbacteria bacterium]
MSTSPRIDRVLETALYVDDMERAVAFYRDVLGLTALSTGERLSAFDANGATVLLLFRRGATAEGFKWEDGFIPPHDGAGPLHIAFAIGREAVEQWATTLGEHGVQVESRVSWERGGKSLYFRDPDGHSLELVTPGTWANY